MRAQFIPRITALFQNKMIFRVKFLEFYDPEIPDAKFGATLRIREISMNEINNYLQDLPLSLREGSIQTLTAIQARQCRVLNLTLSFYNLEWKHNLNRTEETIQRRREEIDRLIKEQNQLSMMTECVLPYQKICARRRG